MKRGFLTLLLLGLGIVTITSGISAKTPVESLVERLPDNTLGFVATSGGDYLTEPFNQSMLGQLWHDPSVQQFYQQIKNEINGRLKEDTDTDPDFLEFWEQYLPMIQDILARPIIAGAAINPNAPEEEAPFYGFVIIDATGCQDLFNQMLQKIHSKADKGDIARKKIAGHTMFTKSDEDEPIYWGWVDQFFVLSLNEIEGLALQYLSGSVNRPNSPASAALNKVKATNDALVIHADLKKIWQLIRSEAFKQEKDRIQADQVLNILGLKQLNSLTGRFGFSGQNLICDALLEVPPPHTGLVASFQPVRLDMLDYVEDQVIWTTVENLNLSHAYDIIMAAMEEAMSPKDWQEIQDAIRNAETKVGFSFRRDLLESLAGQIVSFSTPAGVLMEAPFGGLTLLVELKDSAKMEMCLNQVEKLLNQFLSEQEGFGQGMVQINQVELDGKTVHVWTIPFLAFLQMSPSWTIADNQLILASNPALARRSVQRLQDPARKENSVRRTESFQQVTKNLPKPLLSFGYTNSPVQFKQLLTSVQQFWPMVTMLVKTEWDINLPGMLPMLDHLIAKIGPACDVCWYDADGIHLHSQGPFPPAGSSFVGGIALGVSIMLPALGRAREMAQRVQCASQLRGLGNAIAMYNNDYNGRNPKTLQELIETEDVSPKTLVCPSSDDEIGQCSYIYRGADLTASADSSMIVAYDKFDNHDGEARNVLFAGGHVERYEEEDFQELIRKDNALRRKRGLPEKPADVKPVPPKKKRPTTFE